MTRRVSEGMPWRKGVQGVWGVEDLRKRPAPEVEGSEPVVAIVSLSQDWTNPSNGNNAVAFDVANWDPYGMLDTGIGNGLIVPTDGVYIAHFHATLPAGIGTGPSVSLYWGSSNGTGTTRFAEGAISAASFHATVTGMRYMVAGFAIFAALGKSGGTQTIDFDSSFGSCYMTVARLGGAFTATPPPMP